MIDTLKKDFKYYLDQQDVLVEEHAGKVIVVKECSVLGVYDTHLEAFTETIKQHERGTFIIQQVSEGNEAYTATFYSPVISTE